MEQGDLLREISRCYADSDPAKRQETPALYRQLPDPCGSYLEDPVLFYAASYADSAGVAALLERGADPGARDHYDRTALHILAYGQSSAKIPQGELYKTALALLEAGVSPLRKDGDNRTCAFIAAEKGKHELIAALAEKGKKLDTIGPNGQTPLHAACNYACHAAESFFKYSKPKYDELADQPEPEDDYNKRMHLERLKSRKYQYDIDKAAVDKYFETVRLLVAAGLDPEQKNDRGETAVEIAFNCRDVRIAALLAGQDPQGGEVTPELRTKGMQAMQAVNKQDYDALAAILELGGDPNAFWDGPQRERGVALAGKTPLALACAMLDQESVALLLAHGADPNLKDGDDCIPPAYCFSSAARVSHNTFRNEVPTRIFKGLVEAGLRINQPADRRGDTLLGLACRTLPTAAGYNNDTLAGSFLELLLAEGADPNLANLEGVTPLMHLCKGTDRRGEDAMISLLERGAQVFAQDKNGDTPLIYLCRGSNQAQAKAMAELLFDFGDPQPQRVNNEGKTALDYAVASDNELLVRYLLDKS